jgi:hypothetical protein
LSDAMEIDAAAQKIKMVSALQHMAGSAWLT